MTGRLSLPENENIIRSRLSQHAKPDNILVYSETTNESSRGPPLAVFPVLITLLSIIILQVMPKKRQLKSKGKSTLKSTPPTPTHLKRPEGQTIHESQHPETSDHISSPLIHDWLDLYSSQASVHSRIAHALVSAGYISLEPSDTMFPDIKISSNSSTELSESTADDIRTLLKKLQNQTNDSVNISTRSVTPPTKATASMQTSPSRSPARAETPLVDAQLVDESRLMDQTILGVPQSKRISCKLNNEYDLSLEFMNRGNNSAHDIQTYLQEKLDVLDFLQQDHTSTSRREKLETSRLHLPRRTQEQPTSVSDWLNDTASSTSAPTGGFFIGTPVPSGAAVDEDRTIHEVDAALLNDSEIRWETDSMISSASSPMRRARDRSGSLFSHYRGRDRVSRLAANSLDFADDESEAENSFLENTSVLGKSGVFGFGTGRWF